MPNTRYVRPDTSHSATRDGLSYATAWGGWSEIVWGGSNVNAGSTLYVCDAHVYSAFVSIGNHGGTLGNRCTIRGDLAGHPGSITFTTTLLYVYNTRPYTVVTGFAQMQAIVADSPCVGCDYTYNNFAVTGDWVGLKFSGGGDHADILVDHNTFTSLAPVNGAAVVSAVQWFVSSAGTSTMSRLTITNNVFNGFLASRGVLHLRSQTNSNALTRMQDLKVNDNTWLNCNGLAMDIESPGVAGLADQSAGVQVLRNSFTNITATTGNSGGAIFVSGFADSKTPGFGANLIRYNVANNIQGDAGFIDALYGKYFAFDNYVDGVSTNNIDGNGILFDLGCHDCIASRNTCKNMVGKAGVANSGCGIMILGGVTNSFAYGNLIINAKTGIFLGATSPACQMAVNNNVFVGITDQAVYASSSAALLQGLTVKNNVFVGAGYTVNEISAIAWTNENNNVYSGFASGAVNHTLGAQSITDPVNSLAYAGLDSVTYQPIAGSRCAGAGTFAGYCSDLGGIPFRIPPSIGAYENRIPQARAPRV